MATLVAGGGLSLRLTQKEHAQASAYRRMVARVRARAKAAAPAGLRSPQARQIDKAHKAAISRLFCIATALRSGIEIHGVHVAHVRFSSAQAGARNPGLQRKPDDRWTLPLSPHEHRLQHSMGEAAYWDELNINPHALAAELWASSPDEQTMLQVLREQVRQTTERVLSEGRSSTKVWLNTAP